jgi:Fas-binding factor 1
MIQKIKQLEYENQDLHLQLQHNKAHHELQIQLIQDGYEERIRVMKEDRENSMKQLREEKDSLKGHIELIEKEKQELSHIYKRKLDESQREYDAEVERLRQLQRDSIDKLKDEHEEVIKRIKKFKETELNAAMSATSHTRTIESVLNLIEDNTKNLDSLNQKVEKGHMNNLSDFEAQLKNKKEQLRRKCFFLKNLLQNYILYEIL